LQPTGERDRESAPHSNRGARKHYRDVVAKTRIICTLGPASSSKTVVRDMMLSGMDVARLNFSHGTPQESRQRIDLVRTLNRECGRRVELLGDLQGHRIRIGELSEPVQLTKGETLWLTQEKVAAVG